MHVGISGVAFERNDLATAAHHLQLARELGDAAGLPQNPYRWRVARRACSQPRETCPRRSSSSTRPSRCTSGTSPRTCAPSPRGAPDSSSRRGDLASATSWAPQHRPGRRRRALLPARVRAHHLGDGAAGPTPGRALAGRRAGGADSCSSGCWPQRRRAAGRATCIEILVQLALASEAERRPRACHGPARSCAGPWRGRGPHPGLPRRRTSPECGAAQRRAGLDRGAARARSARRRCAGTAAARPVWREHTCDTGTAARRPAQRAGARRPAAARQRPGWARHRARAQRVGEHGADPHPPHLRQARRHQPTRSRPRSRTPGSAAPPGPRPQPLGPDDPGTAFTACGR